MVRPKPVTGRDLISYPLMYEAVRESVHVNRKLCGIRKTNSCLSINDLNVPISLCQSFCCLFFRYL